jgi:AcrR family transcriptional regulator
LTGSSINAVPRSEKDNEEIRAARRREILTAATEVFAKRGLARTKVTDIAAAANLSHGLLYHYFPSKEAVFEALVEQLMERAAADVAAPRGRAIDRLRQILGSSRKRLTDETLAEARVVTIALMLGESVSEGLQRRLSRHLDGLLAQMRDVVAEAQADGDLDDAISPDELSKIFLFLFRGMAIRVPGLSIPLPDPAAILALLRPPPAVAGKRDATG